MTENQIVDMLRTAPAQPETAWSTVVTKAANSLLSTAHRLPDEELEAMIGLVALCYQKAGLENQACDEYGLLLKRLANSASLRRN